jgi:hypothetical protein
MIFKIMNEGEIWQDIKLSDLRTKIYKKDIDKMDFLIDSKFSDPITGEGIIMTVPETSEPELSYFGSDTDFITTKVSMNHGELTLYPDNLYIHNKDKMILVK